MADSTGTSVIHLLKIKHLTDIYIMSDRECLRDVLQMSNQSKYVSQALKRRLQDVCLILVLHLLYCIVLNYKLNHFFGIHITCQSGLE